MDTSQKISFIGAGNMARSLIGGLVNDHYPASNIGASDHDQDKLRQLRSDFGVEVYEDNLTALQASDIIVLAVKPQTLAEVCRDLRASLKNHKPLFISIAAGIRSADIENWLGESAAVVRTMPNTPSLVSAGATALYASNNVSELQKQHAESILRAVGLTVWVDDEGEMDAITALSGCGPAYFFLFMELMQDIAEKLGIDSETARLLTLQTGFGATKMALESNVDCAELRRRVTSPGGVTEKAIDKLLDGNIDKLFTDALETAKERSIELANVLGKS